METTNNVFKPEFWAEQWNRLNMSATAFSGYGSAATWNAMAGGYARQPDPGDKDDRVAETIARLERNGIELENARILDIGCGPGRYAEAFARKGAEVVCIDIAEKMIERLRHEIAPGARGRISPIIADWKTLDLESRGFVAAFDLVFANMTPAVSGPETFLKIMRASRRWCWFRGWAGRRENPLLEILHTALFGSPPAAFEGNFLYAWNLVCSLGYFPESAFETVQWTRKKSLTECIELYKLFFSGKSAISPNELSRKIETCLSGLARDGIVENTMRGHTGGMLWTMKEKREDNHG